MIWLMVLLVVAAFSVQADLTSLPPSTAAISPASLTATKDHDFSVDIIAYPFTDRIPNARLNNYKFTLYFDPNYLHVVSAENMVEGLTIDLNNPTSGSLDLGASKPFGAFYQLQPTTLARLTFVPVKIGTGNITFQSIQIINSLGNGGTNANLITNLQGASIFINGAGADGTGGGSCRPNCQGKACGPDGCDSLCGQCREGQQCRGNSCVCIPDCEGRECGTDSCSGSCGSCPSGTFCQVNERTSSCVSGTTPLAASNEIQEPQTGFRYLKVSLGVLFIILALVVYFIYRKKSASALNSP